MSVETSPGDFTKCPVTGRLFPKRKGIDVYDLDRYERDGVPHEMFRELRVQEPVYFHGEPGGRGFWCVTKHADIIDISRDPLTFSSWRGGSNITDYEQGDLDAIRMLMVNMDPPQHPKFRKLISKGLTPRMVERLEPKIREEVDDIINSVIERGSADFVRDVAAELPLRVIAELMGIPREERGLLFDWSNRLIGFDDPEFQTSIEDSRIAAMEIWGYANNLAEDRKGKTGEDLVTILVNAEVDGEGISEAEFDAFFLLLSVAGNETTRNALSGGMLALFENPGEWERLKSDPERYVASAVEEVLRWVTPVSHFRRTATRDVELRGQKIKEDDKVVLFYCAANRDEEVFADPYRFDVGRDPNNHLAFGVGEHFCMGASLARLEMKCLFESLIKRMPDIRANGSVRRLRSNFINGIKELPVAFTPSSVI